MMPRDAIKTKDVSVSESFADRTKQAFSLKQMSSAMWINVFSTLFCGLFFVISAQQAEKYVSCGGIARYCSAHGTASPQGPTSIRVGAKGQKGNIGPPGPPVNFDYNELESRILTKVKEMITKCGVFYENSCFSLVGNAGSSYNKEQLQSKCAKGGGRLANLYTEEHRLNVARYVRDKLRVYAQITLGMTYNAETNLFRYTTGETTSIPFTWHPGYPLNERIKNHMFFSVQPNPAHGTQGVFNYNPTHAESYALCEYDL